MFHHDCNELAEIIKQIERAEQIWPDNAAQNYRNPMYIVQELLDADLETINQVIAQLHDDLNRADLKYAGGESYISMALSYAYCKINENHNTEKYAEDARRQFGRSPSQWNQAMAHCFLGIVYYNNTLVGKAEAELEQALRILKRLGSWAKQKLNYEIMARCNMQIDKIRRVMNELPVQRIHVPLVYESLTSYKVFSQIIGFLEVPPPELDEWLEAVYALEPSEFVHIQEQIDILVSMLEQDPNNESITTPLVNIFLAHCHNLCSFAGGQNSILAAVKYAEEACEGFRSLEAHYNQALSNWYLALIHRSMSDREKSIKRLYASKHLLEGLLQEYRDSDIYEELQSLKRDVENWIDPTRPQNILSPKFSEQDQAQRLKTDKGSLLSWFRRRHTSNPNFPQSTPFRKNEADALQIKLDLQDRNKRNLGKAGSPKDSGSPKRSEKNQSRLQHIIIPIDIQALKDLNVNSVFLEPDLFESLQSYGKKKEAHGVQQPFSLDSKKATLGTKRVKIPGFPIYGQAAAGPRGEPNLDASELEMAQAVYDDLCINLDGKEYDVKFLVNYEYNFLEGKHYGWLKVIGDSMNDCSPIHIKDGSYVLFAENRDIRSCVMKIVVAVLPEFDSEPSQLVVKRLLKLSTQLPVMEDGFAPEYSKFMLHSESLYESDSRTGSSYKDIEIIRDDQIVGEVVAVAS